MTVSCGKHDGRPQGVTLRVDEPLDVVIVADARDGLARHRHIIQLHVAIDAAAGIDRVPRVASFLIRF